MKHDTDDHKLGSSKDGMHELCDGDADGQMRKPENKDVMNDEEVDGQNGTKKARIQVDENDDYAADGNDMADDDDR